MPSINGRSSGMTDQSAFTLQSAAAGTGNGTLMPVDANTESVALKFTGASTPSLTVILEATEDGTNFIAVTAVDLSSLTGALLSTIPIAATVLRYRYYPHPSVVGIRTRVSAVVTGNVTVTGVERRRV